MRILGNYESVNLSTGERTRYYCGKGERISEKDHEILKMFEREMEEVTIPQIVKDIRNRQKAAQKSREWIIG